LSSLRLRIKTWETKPTCRSRQGGYEKSDVSRFKLTNGLSLSNANTFWVDLFQLPNPDMYQIG